MMEVIDGIQVLLRARQQHELMIEGGAFSVAFKAKQQENGVAIIVNSVQM